MTSNHEEYGNDITLENLKCSVQIYEVAGIIAEKVTKELEVIKLAFSYFFSDAIHILLCSPDWKKKYINLIVTVSHFSLTTRITRLIFLLSFVFKKI